MGLLAVGKLPVQKWLKDTRKLYSEIKLVDPKCAAIFQRGRHEKSCSLHHRGHLKTFA